MVVGAVQAAVVIGVARLLFTLPATEALWALLGAVPVYAGAHLILGFALSALADSQMQAIQGAIFFYLPSMLLSGFMFPFQGMPTWARISEKRSAHALRAGDARRALEGRQRLVRRGGDVAGGVVCSRRHASGADGLPATARVNRHTSDARAHRRAAEPARELRGCCRSRHFTTSAMTSRSAPPQCPPHDELPRGTRCGCAPNRWREPHTGYLGREWPRVCDGEFRRS